MYKKGIYIAFVIGFTLVAAYGCRQAQPKTDEQQPQNTFTQNGSVREINIWLETIEFPAHEGKGEFMSYCSMCHSLKYVTMQPEFPRQVWETEVTKMVVKYKAPMDSVTCKKIVDYIMMAQPAFHKGKSQTRKGNT